MGFRVKTLSTVRHSITRTCTVPENSSRLFDHDRRLSGNILYQYNHCITTACQRLPHSCICEATIIVLIHETSLSSYTVVMPLVFKSHSVIWQLVTLFLGVRGSTAFSTSWTNALLAKSSRAFVPRSQAFTSPSTRLTAAAASSNSFEYALLFDCDGVILETEELHRLAYNQAFQEFNLTVQGQPVVWEVCDKRSAQIVQIGSICSSI